MWSHCIEYVKELVEIVDQQELDSKNLMYTVSLGPDFVVDVKVCAETGLVYVMQNADGSTVHAQSDSERTFPGYRYDDKAVMQLVKNKRAHPPLCETLARAESKKCTAQDQAHHRNATEPTR